MSGPAPLHAPGVAALPPLTPADGGTGDTDRRASSTTASSVLPSITAASAGIPQDVRSLDLGTIIAIVWLAGTTTAIALLVGSLVRVRRLAANARPISDAAWMHALASLQARFGLRRSVRLLISDRVRTPMAGGLCACTIYLPTDAGAWDEERRDIVLAHEVAHLTAADPLRHIAARLCLALYWFHPLAWLAARQSTIAREEACDEKVLALGTRASTYAQLLVDLADGMGRAAAPATVLPIVDRSLLERRVMAILSDRHRRIVRPLHLVPLLGLTLLALPLAAAQPAAPLTVDRAMPSAAGQRPPVVVASAAAGTDMPLPKRLARLVPRMDADACAGLDNGRSFSGTRSTSDSGGGTVITRQIGRSDGDRIVLQRFGDLQVCFRAEAVPDDPDEGVPSQWIDRARRIVMETHQGSAAQQLVIDRTAGGAPRTTWRVNSAERPLDAAAAEWRHRLLDALDTTWRLSALRGKASSLRGEISSIRGEESSLRGEISSLRGEVSSMRGEQSAIRGDESSLRGEISAIQGHVSSLRGDISSAQGSISSLDARRFDADRSERTRIDAEIARHQAEITRLEREIQDYDEQSRIAGVEQRIKKLDMDRIATIEQAIGDFDLDGKVAAVEAKIAALDVDGRTAAIEQQIRALDVDRHGREMEATLDHQVSALREALDRIR
jgi:beta-lactamase regulating signal transducer with metallopeptidase domain/predicted  nucleic acid-binding Zn-ribbon protein